MRPERAVPGRPSLASMQAAVMSLITGREAGRGTPDAATLIVGDARANADERMHVYAHMYRARIVEALASQFPRLAKLVGADEFAALVAAYINDEPSRHPSLRFVGERLPPWLEANRSESPTLVGLARLEWARADVFDLADDVTLTLDDVRAWPVDRFGELPLQLVTAYRLISAPAGTARLWESIGSDLAVSATEHGTEALVVWREGAVVYHRLIEDGERESLLLASQSTQFGVVCESLLASHGEEGAVAQAYSWMSTWVADGLIRAVRAT